MTVLGKFGVLHCQQREGRLEIRQRRHPLGPTSHICMAGQVEPANFSEGYIAIAEQVRDGRLSGTEIVAIGEVSIQHRQCGLGTLSMIVRNGRRDIDREKFSLAVT